MHDKYLLKRIISLLLIICEFKIVGGISNIVNSNGIKNYKKIIDNFSNVLNEQNITDPQHIYEYYNYAMWNGYFSQNHELMYSLDRKLYIKNSGMSIMSGKGVCLNYADMLSMIFKKMGFKSYMAICYVNPDNIKIEKIRTDKGIERNIDQNNSEMPDNFILDNVSKILGNHAITCVEYNGEIYIFDPTNLLYFEKTGFNNINIINGEGKFDLRYYTSLVYDNINIFKLIPSTNNKNYKVELISKEELNINTEALEQFYDENKQYINQVSKHNELGTKSGLIEAAIYLLLVSLLTKKVRKLIHNITNKQKEKEIETLFPIIKEYFNNINIKSEYEILKNYKFLNKIGVKNNVLIDICNKSLDTLNELLNEDEFNITMQSIILNTMGYNSTIIYAKKYTNGIYTGKSKIIKYNNDNKYYLYDPIIEELLYEENGIYYSKHKKYTYKPKHTFKEKEFTLHSKIDIENKMNQEDKVLNQVEIKTLMKLINKK